MFDKVDELETIMLGKDKDDPKFAWLKKKFDVLRNDYPAEQYVRRTALASAVAGCTFGSLAALIIHHFIFGCR